MGWMSLRFVLPAALLGGVLLSVTDVVQAQDMAGGSLLKYIPDPEPPEAGTLMRGVSCAGASLEGMTLEEARQTVMQYVSEVENRSVCFLEDGKLYEYNAAALGVGWGNPEILDDLERYVRTGDLIVDLAVLKDLAAAPVDLQPEFLLDGSVLQETVAYYTAAFSREPENATVVRQNGVFEVIEAVSGRSYDTDAIYKELSAKLSTFSQEPLEFAFPYIETAAAYDSSWFCFSQEPLGSYTTGNLGDENRTGNITLAASNMNGHVFYPGELISALNMYGPVTAEAGFAMAPGYDGGRQVQVIGGGICQPTTTLYNAVLRAELKVDYRKQHSMMVNYVPPAMDAMVSPSDGSDFTFYNSGNYPIYIEAYVENDAVTVNIWGVEERSPDRTVSFQTEILEISWPSTLYRQEIDDAGCVVGPVGFRYKYYTYADPHPKLHARSYKIVTENGQTTQTLLNDDTYAAMTGMLYHASDCYLLPQIRESQSDDAVYPYIGYTIFLRLVDSNGSDWPDYGQ